MTAILERYFSFRGRLARVAFFVRGIYLSIAALVIFLASIPLFAGGGVLWWLGLVLVALAIAILGLGTVSTVVRRLHDLGLSGYHAVWVVAAQLGWAALSEGPPDAVWLGLPLLGIGIWLTFYPGNAKENRFGAQPA